MSEILYFEWAQPNDPLIEARAMAHLARSLEDMSPVMEGTREIVVSDVESRFEEERDPEGVAWAEWAESYEPVARRRNIGKLRRRDTEHLYEAATDRNAYHVVGNDMFIDTSGFPEYWAIQQYGGLVMGGGMAVRRYGKRRRKEEGAADHGRIPKRPYLGMSAEAEAASVVVFDQWLEGEIVSWRENRLAGPGIMQPRLRSGQYGKIPGYSRR